jgi:hypothetical protein
MSSPTVLPTPSRASPRCILPRHVYIGTHRVCDPDPDPAMPLTHHLLILLGPTMPLSYHRCGRGSERLKILAGYSLTQCR